MSIIPQIQSEGPPPDVPDGMVAEILSRIGDGAEVVPAMAVRLAVLSGARRWRREHVTVPHSIPAELHRWYNPKSLRDIAAYRRCVEDEAVALGSSEAATILAALPVLPAQATRSYYREALLDALTAPKAGAR
jgi:hypothetical protein